METSEIRLITNWVTKDGFVPTLEKILNEMDCSRVLPIGRPMQTINERYKFLMEAYNYILDELVNQNLITPTGLFEWKDKLENRHLANVEFEKVNPPVVYSNKNKGKAAKSSPSTGEVTSKNRKATGIKYNDVITGAEVIEPIIEVKKKKEARPKVQKVINMGNVILNFNKK